MVGHRASWSIAGMMNEIEVRSVPSAGNGESRDATEIHRKRLLRAIFGAGAHLQAQPEWLRDAVRKAHTRYSDLQTTEPFRRALRACERGADKPFEVFVVGEGNFGKSTLVNALLGAKLSPVSILPETRAFLRFVPVESPSGYTTLFCRLAPKEHDWLRSRLDDGDLAEELFGATRHVLPDTTADELLVEDSRRCRSNNKSYFPGIVEAEKEVCYSVRSTLPPNIPIRFVDTQGLNQFFSDELGRLEKERWDGSTRANFERWMNETLRGKHLQWQLRRCDGVLWLAHARKSSSAVTHHAIRYFRRYGKKTILAVTNIDRVNGGADEHAKVLGTIRDTFGDCVDAICPVDSKTALAGVLEQDEGKVKSSGLLGLREHLIELAVVDGRVNRNMGAYSSLVRTELELRRALVRLRNVVNENIARLESGKEKSKRIAERAHRLFRDKVEAERRRALGVFENQLQQVGLGTSRTELEGIFDPHAEVQRFASVCENAYRNVAKPFRGLETGLNSRPFDMPQFGPDGSPTGATVSVRFRANLSPPRFPIQRPVIEMESETFAHIAIGVAQTLGSVFFVLTLGRLGRDLCEEMRLEREKRLDKRRKELMSQLQRHWNDAVERACRSADAEIEKVKHIAVEEVARIERELEAVERRPLSTTRYWIKRSLSAAPTPRAVPTVTLRSARECPHRVGPNVMPCRFLPCLEFPSVTEKYEAARRRSEAEAWHGANDGVLQQVTEVSPPPVQEVTRSRSHARLGLLLFVVLAVGVALATALFSSERLSPLPVEELPPADVQVVVPDVQVVVPDAELPVSPGSFVLIEAGTFNMGSPATETSHADDETEHEVTITRAFYMQAHEVTQGEWQVLMGNNPSYFQSCGNNCPVENVTWYDALSYANALSREQDLDECYELTGCAGRPGEDMECAVVTFSGLDCEGYRLPTEAEWEYAARAGTATAFYSGSITEEECGLDRNLDEIGWYCGNADDTTHPVCRKSPNDWGLYDMLGNVWEWCWDWYDGGYYTTSPSRDPLGPSSGQNRVRRGGGWSYGVCSVRSADRDRNAPGGHNNYLGLRLARSAP